MPRLSRAPTETLLHCNPPMQAAGSLAALFFVSSKCRRNHPQSARQHPDLDRRAAYVFAVRIDVARRIAGERHARDAGVLNLRQANMLARAQLARLPRQHKTVPRADEDELQLAVVEPGRRSNAQPSAVARRIR